MATWSQLSKRIAARLPPGFVRFQAGPVTRGKLELLAFYRAPAPAVAPFKVTIDSEEIQVEVQTRALPPSDGPSTRTRAAAFTGVHPGAAITVELGNGARVFGAICALLSHDSADTGPTHLVTCGHIFRPSSKSTDVIGGRMGVEAVIGRLVVNLLDSRTQRRDVALVELTPTGATWARASSPGPKLVDYFPETRIFNRVSRTFRPTTGRYSTMTKTETAPLSAVVKSKQWPGGFAVEDVIPTEGAVSREGDSGAPLTTIDTPIVIGSCSASDGGQSLFEPIGRVIDDVFAPKYQLTLWRNHAPHSRHVARHISRYRPTRRGTRRQVPRSHRKTRG